MSDHAQLWESVMQGDMAAVAQQLETIPNALLLRHESGHGLVRLACDCGQRDLARWLVESGAPVDAFDAAAMGDNDRVQLFVVDQPALLHEHSHDGWSLLHLAGFAGAADLLDWLLAQDSDVADVSRNAQANQPLHAALAGAADEASIKRLIQAGADVNYQAAQGVTPLHLAASRGSQEFVDWLLDAGAVQVEMADGQMPADLAAARGFPELAESLRSRLN